MVPQCRLPMSAVNMNRFTIAELADIHFVYALANANGHAAVRFIRKDFYLGPYQMFPQVHQNLYEHESFTVSTQDISFFLRLWVGHGEPLTWPPRSPDLSLLVFFLSRVA
ncbi:hypothetical protein AVEN_17301-1 [Araneus ventricosus]|uniref:Uncharacterized protein n=1 Tax=Araneus ventricosus TaxID=182803 RepID=A0A4Y2X4B2_ARAVE|nr:hypothetical protein AVEN_2064-1 [Araneus ventricosus]GBO44539.1 hypothetical protein AVEN_17301-1 [Araneus ventricosus]